MTMSRLLCCVLVAPLLLTSSCSEDESYDRINNPTNNEISSQWAGVYRGTGKLMPAPDAVREQKNMELRIIDQGNESIMVQPVISGFDQTWALDLEGDVDLTTFTCSIFAETGREYCALTRAGRFITGSIVVYDLAERVSWSVTTINVAKDE